MGQHFYAVNLDRQEYLRPHAFGDGAKFMEFTSGGYGMMMGLALLMSEGLDNGSGGLEAEHPMFGCWAGDRITIVGDYANSGLYQKAAEEYEDISVSVMRAMARDYEIRKSFEETVEQGYGNLDAIKEALESR